MGKRFSFLQNCPDQVWDPFNLLYSGYRGSFPGEKQPERDDGHSSLPSAEAEFECRCTFSHGMCKDIFTYLTSAFPPPLFFFQCIEFTVRLIHKELRVSARASHLQVMAKHYFLSSLFDNNI